MMIIDMKAVVIEIIRIQREDSRKRKALKQEIRPFPEYIELALLNCNIEPTEEIINDLLPVNKEIVKAEARAIYFANKGVVPPEGASPLRFSDIVRVSLEAHGIEATDERVSEYCSDFSSGAHKAQGHIYRIVSTVFDEYLKPNPRMRGFYETIQTEDETEAKKPLQFEMFSLSVTDN